MQLFENTSFVPLLLLQTTGLYSSVQYSSVGTYVSADTNGTRIFERGVLVDGRQAQVGKVSHVVDLDGFHVGRAVAQSMGW